jgi:IS30 family transposase
VVRNGGPPRYRATPADAAAWQRAERPKPAWLASHVALRAVVERKLEQRWSPKQIAHWLPRAYPDDPTMRVSHEKIYLSLFVQGRGALRREALACLCTRRRMRTPRGVRANRAGGGARIRAMLSLRERPPDAEDRAVPGHWEGDLLVGRDRSGAGTLVERTSRFCGFR